MLSIIEKNKVNEYLEDSEKSKQVSFSIQREQIGQKHPNAILAEQNQSLEMYVSSLLNKLPYELTKTGYLAECLMYLCEQENHDLVSCTKELYSEIASLHQKKYTNIERSLRHFISEEFNNIPEDVRNECFSVPEGVIPSNFYFLSNLAEYIKTHYFYNNGISLTPEQQSYFLENLQSKDNAMNIIVNAERKREVEKFLYSKLGHFSRQTTVSNLMLTDLIMYYMDHPLPSIASIYENEELNKKWDFYDYDSFTYKMRSISFTIATAFQFVDLETYKQIFGDTELHRGFLNYLLRVCEYLKEQEYQRSRRVI